MCGDSKYLALDKQSCVASCPIASEGSGSTGRKCLDCDVGDCDECSKDGKSCLKCAVGRYTTDGSICAVYSLNSCPLGQGFTPGSATADDAACTPCSSNTFSATNGTGSCMNHSSTPCLPGFGLSPGSMETDTFCAACTLGKFSATTDAFACKNHSRIECPIRQSPAPPSATADSTCAVCADGKYSDDKDDAACKVNSVTECPPDWGLLPSSKMADDAVCERCKEGWFSFALDANRCISQAEIDKAAADAKAAKEKAAADAKTAADAKISSDTATDTTTTSHTIVGTIHFPTITTPDNFTPAMQAGLKATLATKCGVSADKITLVITAARRRQRQRHQRRLLASGVGVNVAYTVQVDSRAAADQGKAALAAIFAGGDTAMLSFIAALQANTPEGGFAAVDVITIAAPVVKNTTGTANSDGGGAIGGTIVAVVVVAIIVVVLLFLWCRRNAANKVANGEPPVIAPHTSVEVDPAAAANGKRSIELSVQKRNLGVGFDGDDESRADFPNSASRQPQLKRSDSNKHWAAWLTSITPALRKYAKVFARESYMCTSDFANCSVVEIDELLDKLKDLKAPDRRKLRAALLKLGSDGGAGGEQAASPGHHVRTVSMGAQNVLDMIDSDAPINDVSWATGTSGQDAGGQLRSNRGSSVIDADNMAGTTINSRFLIKCNHGATVSSGSSMLFEAEDLESNDAVMLKFIKVESEFERERAILRLLNSNEGASHHVSVLPMYYISTISLELHCYSSKYCTAQRKMPQLHAHLAYSCKLTCCCLR